MTNYHPLKGFQPQRCNKDRKKRLCYYYEEKYELGHKCKKKQNFLLDGHDNEVEATCEVENNVRNDDLVVSINVIFGSTSHQTMIIYGNIKKKVITY